jgi:hypothetical protein
MNDLSDSWGKNAGYLNENSGGLTSSQLQHSIAVLNQRRRPAKRDAAPQNSKDSYRKVT